MIEKTFRHRIREVGGKALSNAELFQLVFRLSADAAQALSDLVTEYGSLGSVSEYRLQEIVGIGSGTVDAIKAVVEIVNRECLSSLPAQKPVIQSPADVAQLLVHEMGALEQEHLRVVLLNVRNRVLDVVTVYVGSAYGATVRVGELFRDAIRQNASAIILVHNHPSGDPTPSPDDVAITRAVVKAGKNLDIAVLDHIIIGRGQWVSLKDRQLGF